MIYNRLRLPNRMEAIALLGGSVLAIELTRTEPLAAIYLLSLAFAFILGLLLNSLQGIWIGACVLVSTSVILEVAIGSILNPNYVGCAVALCFASSIAYRLWWFAPVALVNLFMSQSRGMVIGIGAATIIGLLPKYKVLALVAFAIGVALVIESSIGRESSMWARIGIWQDTTNHFTLWGHGFGSFASEYAKFPVKTNMTLLLAPAVYNDFLQLIFELGLFAIPLWLVIVLSLEAANREVWLIVGTFTALGLTYFPFYILGLAHLFFLTLGYSATLERKPYGTLAPNRPSLP